MMMRDTETAFNGMSNSKRNCHFCHLDRVALQSRTYEKYKLEKTSQFSRVAFFVDFIY